MEFTKKRFAVLLLLISIASIGSLPFYHGENISLADDNDREEEEEDDDDDDRRETSSGDRKSTSQASSTPKTTTAVVQKSTITTVYDSDGDGIFDPDDPHPEIPEFVIVSDENANGIVDSFEKK